MAFVSKVISHRHWMQHSSCTPASLESMFVRDRAHARTLRCSQYKSPCPNGETLILSPKYKLLLLFLLVLQLILIIPLPMLLLLFILHFLSIILLFMLFLFPLLGGDTQAQKTYQKGLWHGLVGEVWEEHLVLLHFVFHLLLLHLLFFSSFSTSTTSPLCK